jgi:mannose-6-phosphate isomerase-like protein (cupin superfamily)
VDSGYNIVDEDDKRPWGAFFRINNNQVSNFIKDFFPNIDVDEIKMGQPNIELSPKILLVQPKQRLSWQYHDRRAECWTFITDGAYSKSSTNNQGIVQNIKSGDFVQINKQERHRLIGLDSQWEIVAEIWQHTDPNNLSSEDDIIRLADDYNR